MTHPLLSCRPHPRYLLGGSKNPPASIELPALLTQDINWIDGETRVPLHCLFALGGGPAHLSRAHLGRAPLIFDREALRASARLLCMSSLVFPLIVYSGSLSVSCAPAINRFSCHVCGTPY